MRAMCAAAALAQVRTAVVADIVRRMRGIATVDVRYAMCALDSDGLQVHAHRDASCDIRWPDLRDELRHNSRHRERSERTGCR
jgi:hypothetical protein